MVLEMLVGQRVMRQWHSSLSAQVVQVLLAGRILLVDEIGDCIRVLRRSHQGRARHAIRVVVLLLWREVLALSLRLLVDRSGVMVHGLRLTLVILH